VRSRRDLYPRAEISSINDVRNGVLLSKTLHNRLSLGKIAFLKVRDKMSQRITLFKFCGSQTPNVFLSCDDIPTKGILMYPELPYRITMQSLVPDSCYRPRPDDDAHLAGTEDLLPPAIVLDYMYGAAAYQRWKSDQDVHKKIWAYFKDHYEPVLNDTSKSSTPDLSDSEEDSSDDERNLKRDEGRQGLLDAMDDVLNLPSAITWRKAPKKVAAKLQKFQKQQKEEESREREIGRMKVEEWRRAMPDNAFVESGLILAA
jgi:hypothetical protein